MASLGLRSAGRVLRRSISDFVGNTQPNKHSTSKFNTGHGKHIQLEKSVCQPVRTRTSLMMKLDEQSRLLRGAHEDVKVMLQQRRSNEAWDKLQKTVILPSFALVGLAFLANKMLFGESTQEMPGEN